jgi:hypothetical protein
VFFEQQNWETLLEKKKEGNGNKEIHVFMDKGMSDLEVFIF